VKRARELIYTAERQASRDVSLAGLRLKPGSSQFKEQANKDIELYGSKIGSLMYLAVQTRPDISYRVSVLSRFLSNLSPQHIKAADRILQYLQGTKYLGIKS
jgi:hypothetical protein